MKQVRERLIIIKNVLEKRKSQWAIIDSTKIEADIIIPKKSRGFTNYKFVNPLKDGSIIVEKSGIDDINKFVKVFTDGTEQKLFTPGYDFNKSLSANDSLLCWNEKPMIPGGQIVIILLSKSITTKLKTNSAYTKKPTVCSFAGK